MLTIRTETEETNDIWDEPTESEVSFRTSPAISTPQHNTQHRVAGDTEHVEIKVPAWLLKFGTLQISLLPNHSSTDLGGSSAQPTPPLPPPPHRTQSSHHIHHGNSQGSPSLRPRSSISRASQQIQDPVPAAINTPTPPRTAQGYPHRRPRPIYPIRPGDQTPPSRTFDSSRSHGYYVVFVGPKLGIFHEYW